MNISFNLPIACHSGLIHTVWMTLNIAWNLATNCKKKKGKLCKEMLNDYVDTINCNGSIQHEKAIFDD